MIHNFKTARQYEKFLLNITGGAFSVMDMKILIEEVKKISSYGVYLEIGVDRGLSLGTALLAAKPGVKVVGIDVVDTKGRQDLFWKLRINDEIIPIFIHGFSHKVSQLWGQVIDVLFIDGDHSYEGCLADIKNWLPFMSKSGVILFHDYDETSPGVIKAVDEMFGDKVVNYQDKKSSMAKVQL